jgi:two-component system NtrC family response regulator
MPKETVLLLDAEPNIQWTLKTFLEGEKYVVRTVDSIEGALKCFQESKISALITEYWIDNSPTLETIRVFKRIFPEAYVMILTYNNIKESEYEEVLKTGVGDFFVKPVSSQKILLHLKKGLKQRTLLLQKNRVEQELNQIKTQRGIATLK